MNRYLMLFALCFSISALAILGCGRGGGNTGPLYQDTDGDGIPDIYDPDIDGDGVPNDQDCFPYDPLRDCTTDGGGDEGNSNVEEQCLDGGNWVNIIDYGDVGGEGEEDSTETPTNPEDQTDLTDCIIERTYDKEIEVEIKYCAHWRDAVLLTGDTVSMMSFADTQYGYIGAFPGLHDGSSYPGRPNTACKDFENGKYASKAHVKIKYDDGTTRNFVWNHPAFAPLSLGLRNIDPFSPTEVNEFTQTEGRATIQYANVNNNFGPGHRMHIIKIDDWRYGPRIYGFKFKYKYDVREEGYYTKMQE